MRRYRFIATALFHLALGCAFAAAQEKDNSEADPVDSATSQETRTFQPAPLDTVYLKDSDGRLVPISRTSLEEYHRYRDQTIGINRDSDYTILSLEATGQATANRVDLSVTLKIVIDTEREEWMRIPLRFEQAALRTVPSEADIGRQRIEFETPENGDSTTDTRRGYVLWLRGRGKGNEETITLDFSVPLSGIGRERRLVLSVPKVAKSELRLTVPIADAAATVSGGTTLEQKANGESATDLILSGFRGEIDLAWRKANGNAAEAAPALSSTGVIKATVARHNVYFEAALSVRVESPQGRELTGFEVRLPPGAVLLEEKSPNYTASDVTPADQDSHEGRIVEVTFQKPVGNLESASVTLHATSDVAAAATGQFPLAGFEVLKAIYQSGLVEVRARGDWDVRCEPGRGVTRIPQVTEGQNIEDVVAVFRYREQPFALAARVFPKQVRIRVEPWYVLSIESGRARLAATLKYAVRGGKAYQLKIDLNGWEFDRVGPEERVVPEACEIDESGMLVIKLQEGSINEFELSLNAHRPIDPAVQSLVLPMPKPQASSLSSTALIVSPADNIELREDREKIVGLERQKVPPPSWLQLPEIQQERLNYRGETDEMGEAIFAAVMSVRQQEISAELSTEVSIASAKATVREHLIYDVKYEPTNFLSIRVPRELVVEYFLDGHTVSAVGTDESSVAGGLVSRKIVLPSPRQGRLELTAIYSVPIGDLQPLASVPCVIPLILPEDATFTGHRLRATVESGIGIWRGRGSAWQEVGNRQASNDTATVTEFMADTPEDRIVLGVHPMDPDTLGSAVVHSAWLQTWLTDSQRRDRAVYFFASDRRRLTVELPSGADTDLLRVLLDGKELRREAEYSVSSDLSVGVDLPPEKTLRNRVLDVRFISESRPPRGRMQLELPKLAEDVWIRRCYWQLVLPGSEHVVSAPKDYTAEYDWAWKGLWWGRVPIMEQADLERWAQVDSDMSVPEATSRYLFSTFGPVKSVEMVTANRTWIVGGTSGVALLIGLVVIYFPVTRHPLFGLVLVIAIVGAAVVWPGASLLAAQGAGMGLVLSLLGAILYRGVARRRRRTFRRDAASSVFERGSTQAQFGSSEVEILRSTATEPDAAAVQAPEG